MNQNHLDGSRCGIAVLVSFSKLWFNELNAMNAPEDMTQLCPKRFCWISLTELPRVLIANALGHIWRVLKLIPIAHILQIDASRKNREIGDDGWQAICCLVFLPPSGASF